MLAENIEAGADSNPLVYLDLLKVLHTLGRKAEFDHYRNAFNAIFSGRIPEYADFNHSGSGLEAYPDVCRRIVQLWSSEEAVDYIEDCLVSGFNGDAAQGFDLEAFRELLMLHGVARRMDSSLDTGFSAFSTARMPTSEPGFNPIFDPQTEAASADDHQRLAGRSDTPRDDTAIDFDVSEPPGNLIEFKTVDFLPHKGPT